jgi:hypothetical protein
VRHEGEFRETGTASKHHIPRRRFHPQQIMSL